MPHRKLKDILHDELIYKHIESDSNGIIVVTLIEKHHQATLKRINIKGIPEDAIILHIERIGMAYIFPNKHSSYSRVDYLIITESSIYFIEMKSSKNADTAKQSDCIKKYKSTECILPYIDEVISMFCNIDKIFINKEKKFILLYHSKGSINKAPTSGKPDGNSNNTAENFLSLAVENDGEIHFKQLK
ncbi:MAG: hypothetical protein KBD37_06005 [Burkholderiales bacterium]|nr:hypothetical protein [Burkholderiales bacterium]